MEPSALPQFRDVPWRWIAYATSTLLVATTAFAFMHEIELKQDVPCEIVSPSEVKIEGLTGLVSSILVQSGAHVEAGTPLFHLQRDLSLASDGERRPAFDARLRDAQLASADAQYAQRRAQLGAQLDGARAVESSRHAELNALDQQLVQNQALAVESQRKLDRLHALEDYVSADRVEQASAELHQGIAATAQTRARRQQLQGEIAQLKSSQADLGAQRLELDARHARDVEDIRLRYEEARQDMTISAPRAGVVSFSSLVPGRTLNPGDVAVVIATDTHGTLRAALRIPSRRRGFVRAGQTIRLKFDAYPYVRYGSYEARIDAISPTTVSLTTPAPAAPGEPARRDAPGAGRGAGEPDYLAWATLPGQRIERGRESLPILPGMTATASIVIERRTVAEWVLEPLFRMLRS